LSLAVIAAKLRPSDRDENIVKMAIKMAMYNLCPRSFLELLSNSKPFNFSILGEKVPGCQVQGVERG
jgi:hypothetical protein